MKAYFPKILLFVVLYLLFLYLCPYRIVLIGKMTLLMGCTSIPLGRLTNKDGPVISSHTYNDLPARSWINIILNETLIIDEFNNQGAQTKGYEKSDGTDLAIEGSPARLADSMWEAGNKKTSCLDRQYNVLITCCLTLIFSCEKA